MKEEYKFDRRVYGKKHVKILAPDGAVLAEQEVNVYPENSIRPSTKYRIRDAQDDTTPGVAVSMSSDSSGADLAMPSSGLFELDGENMAAVFPEGKRTVTFKAEGYEDYTMHLMNFEHLVSDQEFAGIIMRKKVKAGEYSVTCSWAVEPKDLDIHCWDSTGDHCYYQCQQIGCTFPCSCLA